MDGLCIDCFNLEMENLRQASEESVYMVEQEVNRDTDHGVEVSKDTIRGIDNRNRISAEEFQKSPLVRKVFILSLMKMAGINDSETQEIVSKDLEWLIDNQIDKFWHMNIKIVTNGELDGYKVLAGRNNTYIVEDADD